MSATPVIIAFVSILIACVVTALFLWRPKPTIHSFFWGDQRLRPGLTSSLILTSSFSLNGLLYQTWLGFSIGWWSLLIQMVWCGSLLFLALNVHRFRSVLSCGTMHGIIAGRFGSGAGIAAAAASIIGFTILIGWEAVVGASILKNVSGVERSVYLALPVALALVASLYSSMAGLRGNAYINAAQNLFKVFVLLGAGCVLVWSTKGGWTTFWTAPSASIGPVTAIAALGGGALLANLAFSLFWQTVDMSVWQSLSATEPSNRVRAAGAAVVLVLVFPGLVGSIIGIALSDIPHVPPAGVTDGNILNRFGEAITAIPGLGVLLFAAFAAAMLSTIDGYAMAAAQAGTWDITHRKAVSELLARGPHEEPQPEDKTVVAASRFYLMAVAVVGAVGVMALVEWGISLFDLVYIVVIAQMSLVGPVVLCIRHPEGGKYRYGVLPILLSLAVGAGMVAARSIGYENLFVWAPVGTILTSIGVTMALRTSALTKVEAA